jgi:predicted RNase H-like HicB family nuclease
MRNYIAILHKDKDSDFGVSFPDFPGCITAGSTLDEAKDMAREVLPFHIEGLQADGEPIPEPMSLDDALLHKFAEGAQAFFLVEVQRDDPIVRANITVPKGMLERIDRYAKAHHLSRSAFLAQAAQQAMR